MGLFTFLKNGLTIEQKKKEPTADPLPEEAESPVIEDPEPIEQLTTPENVTEPLPTTTVPEEKRKLAEYVLYGDTNIAPATPPATPTPATPEATAAVPLKPNPVQQTYNAYSNITNNFSNALQGQTSANQNLLVVAPKSTSELSAILSNLVSGNACIVSLAEMPDPQRHLDYFCGFMNAIGGTIRQHGQAEYILTPPGVGIKS